MLSKKLFLASVAFFVLVSLPFVGSIGASSEMWSQTYESGRHQTAYSLVETSDGGYAIAGSSGFQPSEDFCLVKTDEMGFMQWLKTFGGNATEIAYSVVETSDGGYVLAGGTASFGAGSDDFWLVKTDANGIMQWNRTYGGPDSETAYSLVKTFDGGYALSGDGLLVKTDVYGNMEWNQTYGGGSYYTSNSLVETSDGGYVVVGGSRLIKIDSQGSIEWNQTSFMDTACSVVETSDGGYTISGYGLLVKTDVYGNMEWNQTYSGPASSLIATSDGGYSFIISPKRWIKTDAQGIMEWTQTYEMEGFMDARYPISVIETSDGGYAIAGYRSIGFLGTTVFWVIKTDAQGIIPEFPSWTPVLVMVVALVAMIVVYRYNLKKLRGWAAA